MGNSVQNIKEESVLIAGGSGLIGRYLTSLLLSEGYRVSHLSRRASHFGRVRVFRWDPGKEILDPLVFEGVDYIINLSGENIGQKRWSPKRKKEIEISRILPAGLLIEKAIESGHHFKAFVSASATGYYGSYTSDKIFTESDPPSSDFLGEICRKWEEQADKAHTVSDRVVKIRTAVVIEKNDSALSKLLIPARMGIFPILGSGRQYMPWVHIQDLCHIYLKALKDEKIKGAYNVVAPGHIDHKSFMKTLSAVMGKPFISPPVPACLLRLILGEMATVILEGSRVSSEKITGSGYRFSFTTPEEALKDALNQ